jgi:hypothetical protein
VTASRFSRARVFAGRPSGETPGREAALILRQPVEFKSQIAVRWSRPPAEQGATSASTRHIRSCVSGAAVHASRLTFRAPTGARD